MEKLASKLLEQAKDFISANPELVAGIAATGGAGALAGAAMTDVKDTDSASTRFKKRLKNALLAGGLGAGAAGAIGFGIDKIKNALPEDDVAPIVAATHSTPVRALGLAGGAGIGAAMQNKAQRSAIADVFGKAPMSKEKLVELLNDPAKNPSAMKAIEKAWGKDSEALKKWIERTGVDPAALKNPAHTNISQDAKSIEELLGKNKTVENLARKAKLNPETLAKLMAKAKSNKYLLGGAGAGLLLPEALTTTGSAIGSMFGNNLYD